MNHYIKKCKECQTVMGQCRCPAENKFVEWAVCEKCSQKTKVSNINEVVERVKARVAVDGRAWIPTDMVGNYVDCASDDIRALLAAYESAVRERDEARANYRWMVESAADQKLDGYRELAATAARAEAERDQARAALRRVREEVEGMLLVPVREGDELCNAIESAKLREVLALINKEIKSDA